MTRAGLTRKFHCGLDVYLTVNNKPSGELGEVFIKLGKQDSTVSGSVQAWAVTISAALQRGVPWEDLREKYRDTKFQPSTSEYTSLVDAIGLNVLIELGELLLGQRRDHRFGDLSLERPIVGRLEICRSVGG